MIDEDPAAEPIPSSEHWSSQGTFDAGDAVVTPWTQGREHLANGRTYWLATARPSGPPHVMPLLAVWVDSALFFVANSASRKARNLERNPHCVIAVNTATADLVVEGDAAITRDDAALHRAADAYMSKYGWPVTVVDGAFHADGAPTAGPPPYDVYRMTPRLVFGFGTDDTFSPTRWRFRP